VLTRCWCIQKTKTT